MREWVTVGSLGVVAISLLFGRTIATSFSRIGESADERKIREYKEARGELAEAMIADGDWPAVDGGLTLYQKKLLETGYWDRRDFSLPDDVDAPTKGFARPARSGFPRDHISQTSDDGSDNRLAIQARREEMKRWGRIAQEGREQQ